MPNNIDISILSWTCPAMYVLYIVQNCVYNICLYSVQIDSDCIVFSRIVVINLLT